MAMYKSFKSKAAATAAENSKATQDPLLRAKSPENQQNLSRDPQNPSSQFQRINESKKQPTFAIGIASKKNEQKKTENGLNTSLIDTAKNFLK